MLHMCDEFGLRGCRNYALHVHSPLATSQSRRMQESYPAPQWALKGQGKSVGTRPVNIGTSTHSDFYHI